MEMEDGGRREVMVAMEVKNEVEKMKMEVERKMKREKNWKVEGYMRCVK